MTAKEFWNKLDKEVQEYLSMRYYNTTRCVLEEKHIEHIVKEEKKFMKID